MKKKKFFTKNILMLSIALLVGAPFFLLPQSTFACSCPGMPYPPEQAFSTSEEIFSGKVISITKDENVNEVQLMFSHYKILFQVLNSWKGGNKDTVTVATGISEDACGISFQEGENYIVYAYGDTQYGAELATGLCQRTKPLASAQDDLAFLNPQSSSSTGEKTTSTTPKVENYFNFTTITISILVVALIGTLLYFLRRKR
jgi:hypothetical protein